MFKINFKLPSDKKTIKNPEELRNELLSDKKDVDIHDSNLIHTARLTGIETSGQKKQGGRADYFEVHHLDQKTALFLVSIGSPNFSWNKSCAMLTLLATTYENTYVVDCGPLKAYNFLYDPRKNKKYSFGEAIIKGRLMGQSWMKKLFPIISQFNNLHPIDWLDLIRTKKFCIKIDSYVQMLKYPIKIRSLKKYNQDAALQKKKTYTEYYDECLEELDLNELVQGGYLTSEGFDLIKNVKDDEDTYKPGFLTYYNNLKSKMDLQLINDNQGSSAKKDSTPEKILKDVCKQYLYRQYGKDYKTFAKEVVDRLQANSRDYLMQEVAALGWMMSANQAFKLSKYTLSDSPCIETIKFSSNSLSELVYPGKPGIFEIAIAFANLTRQNVKKLDSIIFREIKCKKADFDSIGCHTRKVKNFVFLFPRKFIKKTLQKKMKPKDYYEAFKDEVFFSGFIDTLWLQVFKYTLFPDYDAPSPRCQPIENTTPTSEEKEELVDYKKKVNSITQDKQFSPQMGFMFFPVTEQQQKLLFQTMLGGGGGGNGKIIPTGNNLHMFSPKP